MFRFDCSLTRALGGHGAVVDQYSGFSPFAGTEVGVPGVPA